MPPPISGQGTFGYSVLQTTIRQVYPEAIVAPGVVVATTDSRHMTALSKNIYRFLPVQVKRSEIASIHGLDERIKVEEYRQTVRWYRQLFLNGCK